MLIGAALGHADRYVGTAVFTGGSSQRSDTQGLSDARLTTLTDLLDRARVSGSSRTRSTVASDG